MEMIERETVQVSFRLERGLVKRMRQVAKSGQWPPPPSQTEIVARGIEMVLRRLENKRGKGRETE
jgi:hypothetical protein